MLASVLLSGENATDVISPVCPLSVAISFWERGSHNFTVQSSLPVAKMMPSGENAAEVTSFV